MDAICISIQCASDSNRSVWRVIARNPLKYCIKSGDTVGFEFTTDHQLLLPFNALQSELYFNGEIRNEDEVFSELLTSHFLILEDHYGFHEFVTLKRPLNKELPFGLLGKGPDRLMKAYSEVLERHSVQTSIINARYPSFWNGETWVEKERDIGLLFMADSFVIASDISVQPIQLGT
jgi:hypothetical protein